VPHAHSPEAPHGEPDSRLEDPGLRDCGRRPDRRWEAIRAAARQPLRRRGRAQRDLRIGFRNPWRGSIDRATGALYVGDVGQGAREEIDIVTRGGNYGWRVLEGDRCTGLEPDRCDAAPVTVYTTHTGGLCAVTGGYVYRGSAGTLPTGSYVFADYCSGEIWRLEGGSPSLILDTGMRISSFGEDEAGEIYVVDHGGAVHRIVNGPDSPRVPAANGPERMSR
jgi:hypothetical protein